MNVFKNSTVVRKDNLPKLWDGFATAVPVLAEPVLRQLFLTPVRKVAREVSPGRLLGFVESRGHRISVRASGHGPVVLLVHGWQGHMGQFSRIRDRLVGAGYCVVGFDMPAHGETTGRTSSIVEFSEVLASVVHMVGPVHSVVAHSLGGTALSYALNRGLDVGSAIVVAPMVSFDFALDEFAKFLGLGSRARELTAVATEKKVGVTRAQLDLTRFARPHERLLLIHDRDDRRTRHSDTITLSERWSCPLFETEGLGHSGVLRDEAVVGQIRDFMDRVPRPDAYDLESHLGAVGSFEI